MSEEKQREKQKAYEKYVKKLISVLSHLLVVQQQKLLLSQLLQTIIKELNILSLTLKLHQMLLLLILI